MQIPPKFYANFNKTQPKEYWDYDNFENEWGVRQTFKTLFRISISMRSLRKLEEANIRMCLRACVSPKKSELWSRCLSQSRREKSREKPKFCSLSKDIPTSSNLQTLFAIQLRRLPVLSSITSITWTLEACFPNWPTLR